MTSLEPFDLLESLRNLPESGGGRQQSLAASVPPSAIREAAELVDRSGIVELIEQWLRADLPGRARRIGRPESLPPRAYVVAAMALGLANRPLSLTNIHGLVSSIDLRFDCRQHLGFATSANRQTDRALDAARRKISYQAVARMGSKIARTFDPMPLPAHRALTDAEADDFVKSRDPADVAMRQTRADELQARLLLPTFLLLPDEIRAKWRGDITLDGTVIPTWGKFGHHSRRRVAGPCTISPEAGAGWHAKDQDKRDLANLGPRTPDKQYTFGYDAHLALMTSPGESNPAPALVLGISLDRPGIAPGLNAAHALAPIKNAGLPTGMLITDLGYSQLASENFAIPAGNLGYDLVQMVKTTGLGQIQATHAGLIVVEGTVYCSCISEELIAANKTFSEAAADPDITDEQLTEAKRDRDRRLELRHLYQARLKGQLHRPDGSLATTLKYRKPVGCCGTDTRTRQRHEAPPRALCRSRCRDAAVCHCKETVSVPTEAFIRYLSAVPYKDTGWHDCYTGPRNQMEGRNGLLKNPLGADIADAGQRRFRGWAKQLLAVTIKIVASNIHVLLAWIDHDKTAPATPPRKQRSDKRPDKLGGNLGPNAPPQRIAGHKPESIKRRAA